MRERLRGWFKKQPAGVKRLVQGVAVLLWLSPVVWACLCAVNSATQGDGSGWWQVAVAVFGLPPIFVQLWRIAEAGAPPKLSLWWERPVGQHTKEISWKPGTDDQFEAGLILLNKGSTIALLYVVELKIPEGLQGKREIPADLPGEVRRTVSRESRFVPAPAGTIAERWQLNIDREVNLMRSCSFLANGEYPVYPGDHPCRLARGKFDLRGIDEPPDVYPFRYSVSTEHGVSECGTLKVRVIRD